jgi:hypothetical protein
VDSRIEGLGSQTRGWSTLRRVDVELGTVQDRDVEGSSLCGNGVEPVVLLPGSAKVGEGLVEVGEGLFHASGVVQRDAGGAQAGDA